jgi:hypothetical protein
MLIQKALINLECLVHNPPAFKKNRRSDMTIGITTGITCYSEYTDPAQCDGELSQLHREIAPVFPVFRKEYHEAMGFIGQAELRLRELDRLKAEGSLEIFGITDEGATRIQLLQDIGFNEQKVRNLVMFGFFAKRVLGDEFQPIECLKNTRAVALPAPTSERLKHALHADLADQSRLDASDTE